MRRFRPTAGGLPIHLTSQRLPEVYLQPFPGPGDKRLVSSGGGQEPRWSRDGRQLFYRQGTKMLVADTQVRPTFMARRPHLIFEGPYAQSMVRSYDLARMANTS